MINYDKLYIIKQIIFHLIIFFLAVRFQGLFFLSFDLKKWFFASLR